MTRSSATPRARARVLSGVAVTLAVLGPLAVTSGASATGDRRGWTAEQVPASDPPFAATVRPVSAEIRRTMIGVSWHRGCPVPIRDLRVITMRYLGFDGRMHPYGKLMVHKTVTTRVVDVFRLLYRQDFPIRRMRLIEKFNGSDDASMDADNTSAFNCREVTGGGGFSVHSYGRALDINTVENPYVKGSTVLPEAGRRYLDRSNVRRGMIVDRDTAVREFGRRGFDWGGHWTSLKDYQHFEIPRG